MNNLSISSTCRLVDLFKRLAGAGIDWEAMTLTSCASAKRRPCTS